MAGMGAYQPPEDHERTSGIEVQAPESGRSAVHHKQIKTGLTLDAEIDLRANEVGRGHHLALAGVASVSRDLGSAFEGSAEI
jgi:hypothetical protein